MKHKSCMGTKLFCLVWAPLCLLATTVLAQPPELSAPYSAAAPTIDGVIDPTEWQSAAYHELTFVHYLTPSTQSMPVWIMNDGTSLYIAAKAPFASDPYFWYGLYFDGDHSHVLHGSSSEPHVTVDYNKAGTTSPAYSFYNDYRYIQAGCVTYSTTPPAGADHAFAESGISELSFEYRIPLTDLTALPGDTVGFSITLGVTSTFGDNWTYPINASCDDLLQWANLSIDLPPVPIPFCDDFESYQGSEWSINWFGSGNSSSVALDNTIAYEGSQSIYMFGVLGGCWGTVLTRPLGTTYPMTIDVAVRNGSEPVSGCHPFRSALILRPGQNWWEAGLPLFMFLANGDLRITFASLEVDIPGFSLEQWYRINVALFAPGDGLLHARFTIDGNPLGEYTRPWESWMANDQYVSIQVDEGSAWFDNVCVSEGIDNGELLIPSLTILPCDDRRYIQPVQLNMPQNITAFGIPLKIPAGVIIDSVGRAFATEGWSQFDYVVKPDSGFIQVIASAGSWEALSMGLSTVCNIYCSVAPECQSSQVIHWDTALSEGVGRCLQVSDLNYNTSYPTFDLTKDSSTIKGYIPGDVNSSGGSIPVDLSDLSWLVGYLTGTMPPSALCVKGAADVTGNGTIDISDLSMLVAYLTGAPITLRCSNVVPVPKTRVADDIALTTSLDKGSTMIVLNTASELRAIQLEVRGSSGTPVNVNADQFDLLTGESEGITNLILIDLKGKNFIGHGTHTLLEIPGKVEIIGATVSDMEFNSWTPVFTSAAKPGQMPTDFSLSQNYPNPFNPSTTISFSLPTASDYTLIIYNVMGQVIEEFSGHSEPGTVSLAWDGSRVASGVYFYRLTAGEFTETKKMMLLK